MIDTGKIIIGVGVIIVVIGAIVLALGRAGFHDMPSDIKYESPSVRFYFPIVTCIVLSAILTVGMWIWQWLTRR